MNFKNKNILVVSPFFFDYHVRLKSALEARGANVDVIDEQPSHSAIARICMRKDFPLYHGKIKKYFDRQLDILKEKNGGRDKDYDFILFIKCEAPTIAVLKRFQRRFPLSKKILYLWDSVKNIKSVPKKFAYFNKIYSFDAADVKQYSFLKYAYWGYTHEFEPTSCGRPKYDLAFIGTLHSIRPTVISQIEEQCKQLGLRFFKFVYIPHPLVYVYNKLFNVSFRKVKFSQVKFSPLCTNEMLGIYKKSVAVLEIENTFQTGATTRLGEMIGMQKKIVTTFDCTGYDFYNKNNQLVIDVNDIKLNKEFFTTPYEPIDENIRKKYSFDAFLDTIFK